MQIMNHSDSVISNVSATAVYTPQQDDEDHQLFFVTSYSDFDKLGK